jgi:hypothetical protein
LPRKRPGVRVLEIGGRAIQREVWLSLEEFQKGDKELTDFLAPNSDGLGLYSIGEGVEVRFKNPYDSGSRLVNGRNIRELWPATVSEA